MNNEFIFAELQPAKLKSYKREVGLAHAAIMNYE